MWEAFRAADGIAETVLQGPYVMKPTLKNSKENHTILLNGQAVL